ncbi:MAG: alpha/beta hydrolase, partial [Leptospiraceae bacterium]|nr:alpha/beta hydrolase [Leptospiraceae bacterium]
KWIVLGHSMGAVVATYMAQIKQERMEKLILVAPALGEEAGYFLKLVTYLPFVEKITKSWIQNTLSDKEKFGKILQSAYGISPFYPIEEEIEGYRKPLLLENTIEYSFDLVRNSKNKAPLVLKNILIPVYVFHGINDTWVNLYNVMRQIRNFPNAKLIIYSKVGHCPMETNAEEFNRDLKFILKN